MKVYVVVDYSGNVFGVCDSELKAYNATNALAKKDTKSTFDFIECEMNEIEFDGEII
jgi:hypothetical protein